MIFQYFLQFFCKVHHSIKKSLANILTVIKISAATIICPKENAMKNGQKEKKITPLRTVHCSAMQCYILT